MTDINLSVGGSITLELRFDHNQIPLSRPPSADQINTTTNLHGENSMAAATLDILGSVRF